MDSTQIASNIAWVSRLQLLVEGVQRLARVLSAADRERLSELLTPYTQDSAGHYTYRVKGKEAVQEHLQKVGQTIYTLLQELKADYAAEQSYQILERLFGEHYRLEESAPKAKDNAEVSADSLQSLDDLEATYRVKGREHYKGYVANLSETCDPQNELQLITKVQVAPNNVDDGQLLAEALPDLVERSGLHTLITDGGYGGEAGDRAVEAAQTVTHLQTAIRGAAPDPDRWHLSDFDIQQDESGQPTHITCPQGQTAAVSRGRTTGWQARFDAAVCSTCPFQSTGRCPTRRQKRDSRYLLRFTTRQLRSAQRRKTCLAHLKHSRNLRAAVEASVRSVKHPFRAGKLPVRGRFRVACMLLGSAAMTNVRRIQRYLVAKIRAGQAILNPTERPAAPSNSFFAVFGRFLARWLHPHLTHAQAIGC